MAGVFVASGGVTGAVFDLPGAERRPQLLWSATAAAAIMAALGTWVGSRPVPARAAAEPRPQMVVELFEAPAPPPPPVAEPPPPEPPAPSRPARGEPRSLPRPADPAPQAPAPAQAAEVIAQETPADEAVDLTSFTIATGSGDRYAGGRTSTAGTSTRAVTGAVSPDGVPNGTGTTVSDLSRPVRLLEDEWEGCPWPAEADALGIDEEAVILRVTVRADGSVEAAEVVKDPGHGFGTEALACARRSRWQPALDRAGNAVRARSGPVRVLFTR